MALTAHFKLPQPSFGLVFHGIHSIPALWHAMKLKLEQGQIWQQGETYLRIVKWSRQAIDYKPFTDLVSREGAVIGVTKKEFCRLIKGATLLTPAQIALATASAAELQAATKAPEAEAETSTATPEPATIAEDPAAEDPAAEA